MERATLQDRIAGGASPVPDGQSVGRAALGAASQRPSVEVRLRVGAVSYLNTKPLVYRLRDFAPAIDLSYDLPSRLADRLAAGELDVALIPSIEYLREPTYRIVSDACIGCRGPVWSVKLLSRKPLHRIGSLALDEGSRTSAVLARVLLKQRFGTHPELRNLPIGSDPQSHDADAILLIGDRAIHPPCGEYPYQWDLGEEWCRWSQLPFVFAMWVARGGVRVESLQEALSAARDAGVAELEQIARDEAAGAGLTPARTLEYLRDNLYFYLGQQEREGLQMFYREAAALDGTTISTNRAGRWPSAC